MINEVQSFVMAGVSACHAKGMLGDCCLRTGG